jgi:hypothetical protein
MACPRCRLSRGVDPGGLCCCCGFYVVEYGSEVAVSTGTPNARSAGSTPAAPANPAPEGAETGLDSTAERRLWCFWW